MPTKSGAPRRVAARKTAERRDRGQASAPADSYDASGNPRLTVEEVRREFADALNRVAYGGERIILVRRGRDLAALVPVEDVRLIEKIEDRFDVLAAKKALAEAKRKGEKPIPWEQVRDSIGL